MSINYKLFQYPENFYTDIREEKLESCENETKVDIKDIINLDEFTDKLEDILDKAIEKNSLKKRNRNIFYLRYKNKYSYSYIGSKYNISPERVFKILATIRRRSYELLVSNKIETTEITIPIITEESDIMKLCLPSKVTNCLKRYGIDTVGFLLKFSERELLKLNGIGETYIESIHKALKEAGFKLKR